MNNNATLRPSLTNLERMIIEQVEASAGATTGTLNLDLSTGVTSVEVKNVVSTNNAEDTFVLSGVTTATTLNITDDLATGNRDNNFTVTYTGVSGTADVASVGINSNTSAATLGTITVAGVETLTASSTGGAGATYTLTAVDATTATINASAKSGGTVTAGDLTKVTTLNVNAADDLTVNDNTNKLIKVSTVNVNSQTADKTVTLTSLTTTATASATDAVVVNVIGAGKASISIDTNFDTQSATNADTVTVNAATNSGGVSFTTSATAANKVTGGTGNDTVTLGAALDKDDVIALGGGTADTLVTSMTFNTTTAVTGAYYSDSLATADLPTISDVEVARINLALDAATPPAAGTGAMSAKTASFASTIEINGAAAVDIGNVDITINNIGAGQKVKIGSNLDLDSGVVILTLADATGAADSLTITTDGLNQTETATFEGITAAGVETVSVDLASTTAANTTIAAGTLTFADATSVTLTGSKITTATVDAKDGATIDASTVTGTLELTPATADKYTVKGSATKATKFIMSTGLNNDDTIVGGSATTDSMTATINGLTATTGALKISGVETIQLTVATAASTVNAAGIVGASVIEVGNGTALTGTDLTLTNLAAGTALQLGTTGTLLALGEIDVALADATGANDSLTVKLVDTTTDDHIDMELKGTGIETLIFQDATAAGTGNDRELTVTNFAANKIVLTGGTTAEVFDLARANSEKLNAATSEVDASAFDGLVVAVAATNTATTFKSKVAGSTFTGSAVNDTMQIGTATNFVGAGTNTYNGGNGTDTLTVYAKGSAALTGVTNVETFNIIASSTSADYSSDNITITSAGGTTSSQTGIQSATKATITGGIAGTTVTLSGALHDNGARNLDASGLAGSIIAAFGANGLVQGDNSDAIVVKGGQGSKDRVNAVLNTGTGDTNSGTFTMSGVEMLVVGSTTSSADADINILDLTNVTGLSTLALTDGAGTVDAITVNKLSGSVVQLGTSTALGGSSDEFTGTATLNLASATGTADALTIKLVDTDAATSADTIAVDGIESLTLELIGDGTSSSGEDHQIAITNTNANAATLNVVGTDDDTTLTLSSVASSITTINASTFKSALTVDTGAIGTAAMTITGGEGNDTIGMKNAASVLDGGTKASDNDTLNISFSGTGGALVVDLSSSTDQVQLFNGLANAAVQKNFESVNASAYVQTNSVGADITGSTAANTIVGTAYADTIRPGNGIDTITGGDGNDAIDLAETTAAVDTLVFTAANNGFDTVTGFTAGTGGDVLGLKLILDEASSAIATALDATVDATALATHGTAINISNKVQVMTVASLGAYDTAAEIVALAASGGDWDALNITASKDAALIIGAAGGSSFLIYHINASGTTNATIDTGEVILIGSISADVAGMATGNYAIN